MPGLGLSINKSRFVSDAAPPSPPSPPPAPPPPKNTPLLLDTYSGASAAYSLRKLSNSYSGSALKVRRSNDNAETDIGFSSGALDTTALATFCGSSNGFVVYFYDQSGNNLHQLNTAASTQPKIYDGTTGVVTTNGKPAIDYDGADDFLRRGQTPSIGTGLAVFAVSDLDVTTGDCLYGQRITNGLFALFNNSFRMRDTSTAHIMTMSAASGVQEIRSAAYRASDGFMEGYIDGASDATKTITFGTPSTHTLVGLGAEGNKQSRINGRLQEVVYYETDQVSNQDAIHDNMNDYYSVF